jgi:aminomethyltransferase
LLAVQGQKAIEVLQQLTDIDLASIKYYTFRKGVFAGFNNILISATGYTGAGGFEIYAKAEQIAEIWDIILEKGKAVNLKPIGLGARDTLRLEMGFCLYGNDIDDTTSPIEAGLGWITKTKKGNFTSVETFKRQISEGVSRKLVGFMLQDRRIPRHGHTILNEAGDKIGVVTSGSQSITLDKPIGMGYIQKPYDAIGTTIYIDFNSKKMAGQVVKMPFLN